MKKRDLLKKIEELKKIHQMKSGGIVIVSESSKGIEYINVNGKDYIDHEALAVLRTYSDDSIIIIDTLDDSWDRRTISDDYNEIIFFPTVEDKIDYIRVNKGINPLYHDESDPYHTVTRKEWLTSYEPVMKEKNLNT